MNHPRIVLLCLAVALGAVVTFAVSDSPDPLGPQSPQSSPDPPGPPPTPPGPMGDPEPLGAGCLGGEFQAVIFFAADGTLGITQREFYNTYGDGLWMRGTFDPTAAISPCVAGCFD